MTNSPRKLTQDEVTEQMNLLLARADQETDEAERSRLIREASALMPEAIDHLRETYLATQGVALLSQDRRFRKTALRALEQEASEMSTATRTQALGVLRVRGILTDDELADALTRLL